jgi:hypothetical protein
MLLLLGVSFAARGVWEPAIGRWLVCDEQMPIADALVLDNLDASYPIFKRAGDIQRDGKIKRVFIATVLGGPDNVDAHVVELMAQMSGLSDWQTVEVHETEPIALNAAMRVQQVLAREGVRSIALVTPGFRSERSALVYRSVLNTSVDVRCVPVVEAHSIATWTTKWHSIQEVVLQLLKLEYYRLYVLPRRAFGY